MRKSCLAAAILDFQLPVASHSIHNSSVEQLDPKVGVAAGISFLSGLGAEICLGCSCTPFGTTTSYKNIWNDGGLNIGLHNILTSRDGSSSKQWRLTPVLSELTVSIPRPPLLRMWRTGVLPEKIVNCSSMLFISG